MFKSCNSNVIQLPVQVDDLNRIVILTITQGQADRARRDTVYLSYLVNEELANQSTQEPQPGTSQESAFQDNSSLENDENKSLFLWTKPCINLLLTLFEEQQEEFESGNKRHKKIWDNIASKINIMLDSNSNVTGSQCQSKMNGLKKTFKKILDHNNTSGNDRATWPYFDRMNEVFGASGWAQPKSLASEAGPTQPTATLASPQENTRKRKSELKEYLEIREENLRRKEDKFNRLLSMKEQQHTEKMILLQKIYEKLNK